MDAIVLHPLDVGGLWTEGEAIQDVSGLQSGATRFGASSGTIADGEVTGASTAVASVARVRRPNMR